jgi:hypothetical protein
MAVDPLQKLIFQVMEHRRMTSNSDRMGHVKEVQGDKMRVVMGIKHDGSEWMSPWLHTTDHRGGTTERDVYKQGQNVRLSATGADFRQATVSPYAESKPFPAPAHADDAGPQAKTFQNGKLRTTANGDGHSHTVWVAQDDSQNPQHQDQTGQAETGSGSDSSSSGGQQQQKQDSKPAMVLRVSEKGFLTGRVGEGDKAYRFSATDKGVKIAYGKGKNSVFVTEEGCFTTKPFKIKKDSIKDDDEFH